MTMTESVTLRIVPGAPPPVPLTKTQKKKHKSKGSVAEPSSAASVAPSPSAASHAELPVSNGISGHSTPQPNSPSVLKPSPVNELVHKRLKAVQKKITRIKVYASSPAGELNDDQRRTLQTLPGLELVAKELEEVKKAVEVAESERDRDESIKREATEEAEKFRIAKAVSEAKSNTIEDVSLLLTLLRLQSHLASSHPASQHLNLTDLELSAIYTVAQVLLGEENALKTEVLAGILSAEGELQDVPHSRLLEITRSYLDPPSEELAVPEEPTAIEEYPVTTDEEPDITIAGGPIRTGGGLLFVQESELDAEGNPMDEDAVQAEPVPEEIAAVEAQMPTSGSIDWADEGHSELPEISVLHAKFGGEAVPTEETSVPTIVDDDDGFTHSRGRGHNYRGGDRGRGGYRGSRGGERGGYRGGERGGYRGGERGGYRGRGDGEHHGRGDGEHRGRGGGEYRGRGNGEYRGRGDGEYRGRGSGEYRGRGDGEYRGRGDGFTRRGGDGEHRGRGDGYHRRGGADGEARGRGRGRGRGKFEENV